MSHILIIDDDIHIITVSGKRKAGSDFIGFDAAGAYRRGSAAAD